MAEVAARTTRIGVADDEVAELYGALAVSLRRIVASRVQAPDAVIEDACQFAWGTLVGHRARVRRDTALPWLVTTAIREAWRLVRGQRCELPLEQLTDGAGRAAGARQAPALEELVQHRARLDRIRALPVRQQRLVWLQGLGLSYTEMAGVTGQSTRTVERQLLRAKRTLRAGE